MIDYDLLIARVKQAQAELNMTMYYLKNFPELLTAIESSLDTAFSCMMNAMEQINEEQKK